MEPTSEAPSQLIPIVLNAIAAIVGALGQLFYKRGSEQIGQIPLWTNINLLLGCLMFCGVMVFFVIAYKMGGKMSVVYPFYATTFLWSSVISVFVLGERIGVMQGVGIAAVFAGVSLIAMGQGT